ncbi:MAG: hypothetical protein Q3988_01415 [Gemella sp.]|nr:hypothetical protein [Gemella sp.]
MKKTVVPFILAILIAVAYAVLLKLLGFGEASGGGVGVMAVMSYIALYKKFNKENKNELD